MNRRRFLAGLGVAGSGSILASGAFSRVESRRRVVIETAGDDDAYLRLVYGDQTVTCDGTIPLVELTNQFPVPLETIAVTATSTNSAVSIGTPDTPASLAVGASEVVTLDATCSATAPTTVRFDVTVEGNGADATARNREIRVTCSCASSETANKSGN